MKKRIFQSLSIITIFSILVFNIIIAIFMYNNLTSQQVLSLKNEASHIAYALQNSPTINPHYMSTFSTGNRLTVISLDGTVLYDNQENITSMENHLLRTEVQNAINFGKGEDTRLSKTLGEQTFYYALLLENDLILRVSFTSSSIFSIILQSIPLLLVFSVVFVIFSMFLSSYLSHLIVKPIHPKNPYIYDELLPFVKKIDNQQIYIDEQRHFLEQKIIEFDLISKNIADGLVLLDQKGLILSINQNAVDILGNPNIDYVSKPFIDLTRIIKIQEYIERVFLGEFLDTVLQIQNKYYSFRFSPIIRDESILGSIILIVDNTLQIQNEQLRREFSANVSHELKTPLTSISGYAELIKEGLVKPEDIQYFAENIFNETSHLVNLIEDIIKVSRLDENTTGYDFLPINIKDLIKTIVSKLEKNANSSNIVIKTHLFDAKILAVENVIYEIFYNLIENSIKYNKKNGFVNITMSNFENFVIIEICDTGIGIPEKAKDRIFERFYRADTSHSSEIPGSGLGLSIVKHGVQLHNGNIEVFSQENVGTTFKIQLNRI